jgi:NTP pyrophosphatase (non-canonical NTP hydrolase)
MMKIVVGGSMTFAKEQLEAKGVLESMGYEVLVTDDIGNHVNNPSIKENFKEELEFCLRNDIVRSFFNKIRDTDAYLVVNKEKKGIRGYLGASVLMEMGLAYYLGKKVFLLEEIDVSQSYAMEVAIINPVVLGGDLSKVVGVDSKPSFSLKEVAERAKEMEDDLSLNIDDVLNKLTQEFGEFNDVVQKFRGRYCRKKVSLDEVKGELGDLLFNLSSVCNRVGINPNDFNKFANETLKKFRIRKEDYRR